MLYKNYSNEAILELERKRTGNYGADCENMASNGYVCACCGEKTDGIYIVMKNVVCERCICEELRETAKKLFVPKGESGMNTTEILKNIISDIEDNEMMCYVAELYEKY